MTPGEILATVCREVGLDPAGAELVNASENTIYRLPGGVVARVTRAGQVEAARREVVVAVWLAEQGVPAVRPAGLPTAVVGEYAVTWWRDLGQTKRGTTADVALLLRHMHALPIPTELALPPLAPFVRLRERITGARVLDDDGRAWLLDRLSELEDAYVMLPSGLPRAVVHGDAWAGNVAVTTDGPVLVDLERVAVGPPEWDLTSIGVAETTFGRLAPGEWSAFADAYGHDVLTWPGYPILSGIRELRQTSFAWQRADQDPAMLDQARYRLACIRGERGPRPWRWATLG